MGLNKEFNLTLLFCVLQEAWKKFLQTKLPEKRQKSQSG